MSFLGSAAGAVAGAVGNLIGGALSSNAQAAANAQSWKQTKELYQNRYQWQVQDMRKAGLNPILAATGGGLAAPSVASPQVQAEDGYSKAVSNAFSMLAELAFRDKEADIKQKEAETNYFNAASNRISVESQDIVNRAMVRKFGAETNQIQTLTPLYAASQQAEIAKVYQDIQNSVREVEAQISYLKSGEALNYKQAEKVAEEIINIGKLTGVYDAQKTNIQSETMRIIRELQDPKAANEKGFYESWFGKTMQAVGLTVGSVTPFRFGLGLSTRR